MTLPTTYSNTKEYFEAAFLFLNEFQWIFNTSNTKFIAQNVLNLIPKQWLENLIYLNNEELNLLPFGYINEKWSNVLKDFLTRLNKLKPSYSNQSTISAENSSLSLKGVKPKKIHEIENLTQEIYEICKTKNIETFMDFGCGLGYLTQMLNEKYHYKILGIEGNSSIVKTAILRQTKYFNTTTENVQYISHFIEENSMEFLIENITEHFKCATDTNLGIIGMHACADLTITSLKLFCKMKNVRTILIMPCCYHKMKLNQQNGRFTNIPLSNEMLNVLDTNPHLYNNIINRPFLRLASQQTASRWRKQTEEEHLQHGKNMFERSVIDAILNEDEIIVKSKANSNEVKDDFNDDNDELLRFNIITNKYKLIDAITKENKNWTIEHRNKFNILIETNVNGEILSEILTALQTCIQSLCENIVLLDKVCFIREQSAIMNTNIKFNVKKIVDDNLSPRCYVFIGEKF